uniref:Uncharacterized protein n=1 Tax=Timema cristinae TaxID=61476 RepID=A0A7R9CDR2_TIMCR|nr:unnamed protein product [Timema cristinae]
MAGKHYYQVPCESKIVVYRLPARATPDELLNEKEKYKAIADEMDQTFADLSAQHTLSKKKLPSTITPAPALRDQQCSLYLVVPPSSPPTPMCAFAQQSNMSMAL